MVVVCVLLLDVAEEFFIDETSTGDNEQLYLVEFNSAGHGLETLFVEFLLVCLVFVCSNSGSYISYAFMYLILPNRQVIFLEAQIKTPFFACFFHYNNCYTRANLIILTFINNIQLIRVPLFLFDDNLLVSRFIKLHCLVSPLL